MGMLQRRGRMEDGLTTHTMLLAGNFKKLYSNSKLRKKKGRMLAIEHQSSGNGKSKKRTEASP